MMLVDKRNEIPTMQGIIAGGTESMELPESLLHVLQKGERKKNWKNFSIKK